MRQCARKGGSQMTTEDIIRKLTSRKFWLCLAAFLGSIAASIAGITTSNESVAIVGTVCGVISAAIYAAAEQAVDAARMKAGGANDRD